MRQSQNKNRMRGRGRKPSNPLSRNYESNGPDVKIRGNASHIAEKYAALARDALSAGDPVMAENYLQHAEHYNRIILAANTQQPGRDEQPHSRHAHPGDDMDDDFDGDGADEGGRGGDDRGNRVAANGSAGGASRPRRRDASGQAKGDADADEGGNEGEQPEASMEALDQAEEGDKPSRTRSNGRPRRQPREQGPKARKEFPEGVSADAAALPQSLLGGAARESVPADE